MMDGGSMFTAARPPHHNMDDELLPPIGHLDDTTVILEADNARLRAENKHLQEHNSQLYRIIELLWKSDNT